MGGAPILILGGHGGIGGAVARRLAADGHALHLASRNGAALAELAEELGARHSTCDVLDHGALRATVEAAAAAAAARSGSRTEPA